MSQALVHLVSSHSSLLTDHRMANVAMHDKNKHFRSIWEQTLDSSAESQIISLDAGLRIDGIPALDLWDLDIEFLHASSNQPQKS